MLRRCVLIAAIIGVVTPLEPAWAADQNQVLVLYSTRRDAQIVTVADRELPKILENGLNEGVDYYSEFIDRSRYSDGDYQTAFREFLRLKYAGHQFDLVVAMDSIALEFLAATRAEFAETPIVFFSDRPAPRIANATGLLAELNLAGTLVLATALQPDLRHVFVVSGSADTDKPMESAARSQLRSFESRMTITYLSGLATSELQTRLTTLPRHAAVYYVIVSRDGAGHNFHPLDYVDRVAAFANAPTYSWVDSAMDHGIVGGSLKSQIAETQAVGQLALRVLHGERADSIPVTHADLNVAQVDWRQLRRWGISEARVPAGTIVRFREPSAWDRYRVYILAAISILMAQAVLIAALLVQRARRRKAEMQLRVSYERIRDLGGRLLDAQEEERARIARELHDDLSQKIAALIIDLQRSDRKRLGKEDRPAVKALDRAEAVAKSVRALSHRLHPANLCLIGLVSALSSLQRELSTRDVTVTFSHDDVPPLLPHDVTLCVFRVAQEALRNSIAHSGARDVSIRLSRLQDSLVLFIADNGVGFEVDKKQTGLGLISMGERVDQLGGTLRIQSSPGGGTRIEVRVPLDAVDAKASHAG